MSLKRKATIIAITGLVVVGATGCQSEPSAMGACDTAERALALGASGTTLR